MSWSLFSKKPSSLLSSSSSLHRRHRESLGKMRSRYAEMIGEDESAMQSINFGRKMVSYDSLISRFLVRWKKDEGSLQRDSY